MTNWFVSVASESWANTADLNRRLDIYTSARSKYAKDQEKDEPEQEETTSVGEALRNLSVRVNFLKQAARILSQVF